MRKPAGSRPVIRYPSIPHLARCPCDLWRVHQDVLFAQIHGRGPRERVEGGEERRLEPMEVPRDVVRDVELARGYVVDEALACGVRRAVDKVVGDGRVVKEEADGDW